MNWNGDNNNYMTKTIEEMRKDWYAHVGDKTDIDLYRREIADYWLGVISQRDRELREKIASISQVNSYGNARTAASIIEEVLSLIPTHNKETADA